MSDSWSGSMRGPRVKTPFLLLLLLLLSALSGTVLCQDNDDGAGEEAAPEVEEVPVEENPDEDPPESSDELGTIPTMVSTDGIAVETDLGEEPFLDETNATATDDGSGETTDSPNVEDSTPSPDEGLSPIIILIPVVLVVLIIGMIVCGIFINRRWNKKAINQELGKEDPYLDGSSTEKVPMPMFEEDVPSVLELEMEELDQWMKKDG